MPAVGGARPKPPVLRRATPWREARFVALDFETTGLDYANDHVISYGVVPVDRGRIRVGGCRHVLVRPPKAPSPRSQTVHLLRPTDLAEAPSIEAAAPDLRAALDGRVLLAWFADVEVAFLRGIFGGTDRWWRRRTVDVRDLAIAVDGAASGGRATRGYGLTQTAGRYHVPVTEPHQALDDALVTAQLFLALVGKLPGRPDPTLGDLRRLRLT